MKITAEELLKFKNEEKMLFASNGKGLSLYINLYGAYQIYENGELYFSTLDCNAAVKCFNALCFNAKV